METYTNCCQGSRPRRLERLFSQPFLRVTGHEDDWDLVSAAGKAALKSGFAIRNLRLIAKIGLPYRSIGSVFRERARIRKVSGRCQGSDTLSLFSARGCARMRSACELIDSV